MPTPDIYHDVVKNALRKDEWRITQTALQLKVRADTREEELWEGPFLAAEKDERKIAVAVNSFVGRSDLVDLIQTLGQLALSRLRLHGMTPHRVLYLAVRQATYNVCFAEGEGELLLERQQIPLIVFDPRTEAIVQWVPQL